MVAFGATRVTDTTRLDVIGLPVFAAIRPRAGAGSISVSSGKSLDVTAARVGALAEAFELHSAGYIPGQSNLLRLRYEEYREGCGYSPWRLPFRASQLSLVRKGPPSGEFTFVPCELLDDPAPSLLPAVLVYFPYLPDLGVDLHGMSTNGLASGNSPDEAVLHALLEVIERDVISFVTLGAETRKVGAIECPDVQMVLEAVERGGCRLELLFAPNQFGLPTFAAYLFDGVADVPVFVGHGTHVSASIAALRACTEAVQSRLTHIHGARDDVIEYHRRWRGMSWEGRQQVAAGLNARIRRAEPIRYGEIIDAGPSSSIAAALEVTKAALRRNGFERICVFRYPGIVNGMYAVRVVVPGLEFYTSNRMRVGERLLAYVRSHA